jgi:hypothetical protein
MLNTPGLNHSTIYDVFDTAASHDVVVSGTTATICATTFDTTCELVPSTAITGVINSTEWADEWHVTFENGLIAPVAYINVSTEMIRIIPPLVSWLI